ncbi:5-(carboxyamino)imidazole ribonucleotide synthase [Priestia endophytica]|uniref:5-(carboxyamino)imidazole ribonucleotide synthase n=1 Tax=Priestia endophytica TaxID=135735 RepID=UPI003AF275EA
MSAVSQQNKKRCKVVMNLNRILPGQTIGIIGGGQLGRMMAMSAKEMGYNIAVLEPAEDSPCGQISDIKIVAGYDDFEGIQKLAQCSDVITYEFENVNVEMVKWLEEHSYVPQGSHLLKITQNRQFEKEEITKAGLPIAPYRIIEKAEEMEEAVESIGYPCVLKTCQGGYDGKGQHLIERKEDIDEAIKLLNAGTCVLESWIDLQKEVSVIVHRNENGDVTCLPIGENIHKHHILYQTIVPARVSEETKEKATKIALKIANHLKLVGTLAVEMFITRDGELFVNELAPRPHNSGHYSMNACAVSQFGQHIRAICNWPLGDSSLLKPAVMANLLGDEMNKALDKVEQFSDCHLHLYGKKEVKDGRKMGHMTVIADNIEMALEKINALKIWS